MSTQRALVHKSKGVFEVRNDVPLPRLRDDYIVVKTKAVALNPTDYKSAANNPSPGAIAGCDYAGVVEQVGNNVSLPFKEGDRVAGFIRGGDPENHENGAFAEHVTAKGDIQMKIGDNISFEDAATLGVGVTTVGQGLYQSLGLPMPPAKVEKHTPILIYGGSTATGALAIQYAKYSGCEVITTCSPHNFDLCKRLGADHVFDYKDPEVGKKIRELTKNNLTLAFDTISEKGSPEICADALSSKYGHYSCILPVKDFPRDEVKNTFTLAYTVFGEKFNDYFPASQKDFEFGKKFWKASEELFNSGKIKAHTVEVREGGLEAIPQGLRDLEDGKVSGVKLVYKL
ncbi:GroES-like protein [Sporormia fimetaria CBS 119925]|uniref:GroES-like protein n=1 Tax=Sporormia fimetaria CBS 119925 TaxID=1340428 RepID=A0A6A6V360_9PLEO|nr:GroES-like protein [Sporormia fimetaria CBS 119925]